MAAPTTSDIAEPEEPISVAEIDLDQASLYLNREVSWMRFNERVLSEALDVSKPLLERVKFLAIFSSNLDEFFMIRVSGLRKQLASGALQAPADKMTPAEQLAVIRKRLQQSLELRTKCWQEELQPELAASDIRVVNYKNLKKKQLRVLRRYFKDEIFPALTPLAFDPSHPFPHISNLSINLAVVINDPRQGERFARVKVPQPFHRLLRIPTEDQAEEPDILKTLSTNHFVWLEEVVAANLDLLFPGLEVVAAYPFRVTRDADFEIEEDEASDLLSAMQEIVEQRHFGSVIRLEIDERMPDRIRDILVGNLRLQSFQVYGVSGPLGLSDLMELVSIDQPDLKDAPFLANVPPAVATEESVLSVLRRRDLMLYHPYDSFQPVVDFVKEAANDPDVVAIKQTLYRVGPNSPIVEALAEAREKGKQVAVLVELKARFDEENNIVWARALEEAGVHVVYGVFGLKTHAKMCMVVRRESRGLVRYVHFGTGNYNPVTSRVYTDVAYLTSDNDLTADVADLFNAITGYSAKTHYRKLLVSPHSMREDLIERIERVARKHQKTGDGYLGFKMNSLVDKACIQALYRASQAGVKIDLQVRGICCLRPQVPDVSENIRVTSIVGRFLEHARIYYFRAGDYEEALIGSADLMPRNLEGRVEVLVPIEDPYLLTALRDEILTLHLQDNQQCWALEPSGDYSRITPSGESTVVNSQRYRLENPGSWLVDE